MNHLVIRLLPALLVLGIPLYAHDGYNAPTAIEQINLQESPLFLTDLFAFNQTLGQIPATLPRPLQAPKTKPTALSTKKTSDGELLWHTLSQIPSILEGTLLPKLQKAVHTIISHTHCQAQLTSVIDVLDLDQHAQDHRAQILDLINRFGQIYQCDQRGAHQLYTLITHQLALLNSIKTKLMSITAENIH